MTTPTPPTIDYSGPDYNRMPSHAEFHQFAADIGYIYEVATSFQVCVSTGVCSCPADVLIGDHYDPDLTAEFLATLKCTPTRRALEKYLKDVRHHLFGYVAAHCDHLDHDTYRLLASSPVDTTRFVVAANPAAPSDVLSTLAFDHDPMVAAGVALNPATPTAARLTLAQHPVFHVRIRATGVAVSSHTVEYPLEANLDPGSHN